MRASRKFRTRAYVGGDVDGHLQLAARKAHQKCLFHVVVDRDRAARKTLADDQRMLLQQALALGHVEVRMRLVHGGDLDVLIVGDRRDPVVKHTGEATYGRSVNNKNANNVAHKRQLKLKVGRKVAGIQHAIRGLVEDDHLVKE